MLKAVEDVENALVSYNRQKEALASGTARVARAQKSLALARATEREGLSSLFETLDADRKLKQAEADLANARRNLALQYVALNVAAGRGLPVRAASMLKLIPEQASTRRTTGSVKSDAKAPLVKG